MARETGWLQQPVKKLMSPLADRLWDIEVTGLENIPSSGGALITPNHMAFIDSVFMQLIVPRKILAVGKAEYMDSWKTRYIMPATGMIPLDRSGGKASMGALDQAADSLNDGNLFLIYPEGTRTRDGYLHKGKTGAVRLAFRTGAPIVPVGIVGTDRIQPVDAPMPKVRERCEYHFGKPIEISRFRDKKPDRLLLRQITDEVMYEIGELSGQTYVDVYSGEPLPESLAPTAPSVEVGPRSLAKAG